MKIVLSTLALLMKVKLSLLEEHCDLMCNDSIHLLERKKIGLAE